MTLAPPHTMAEPPLPSIIGSSAAMQEVYRVTRQVARRNASVLLLGETGTGKELIARAIHELSERRKRPFVRVNCGALSESLLESELFGHVRGAFTGAIEQPHRPLRGRPHRHHLPRRDQLAPRRMLQVKLLRVLQEREFERVGDTQTIRVDTRVIAASNRDLLEERPRRRFREDLYYRLNVVPIYLPPLRERREDIPELVGPLPQLSTTRRTTATCPTSQPAALEALQSYDWPGNVRELQNYVERAVVMASGDELTPDLLPAVVRGESEPHSMAIRKFDFDSLATELVIEGLSQADDKSEDLHSRVVDRVEREVIAQVLQQCDGVQIKAAQRLGINRNTLHKKIKDYGLENGSASGSKSA